MDEIELEVFRADTQASRGISSEDIAALAEFDCEAHPIPVVIGHPKSDSPAKGVVKSFRAEGNKLFAKLGNIASDLVDGVRNGELLNRSMAFFSGGHEANPTPGKLAPRHLGFLGGSAPGIPGMTPLKLAFEFSADDDGFTVTGDPAEAIIFEAPATPVRRIQEEPKGMTEEEIKAASDRIAAEDKRLADERAAFAAEKDAGRKAANKGRVDALVTAGKVLPADAAALEHVFNALSSDELEFSADDKGLAADRLSAILSKGPALVDASGKAISPTSERREFSADGDAGTAGKRMAIEARKLVEAEPGLSFEAAVERLTAEQEG